MFKNLYRLVPGFSEINWSEFPQLERFPEKYISGCLGRAFRSGDVTDLDPVFVEDLQVTLNPRSCEAFLLTHKGWPVTERDYYLSKLFQFAYTAISQAFPEGSSDPEPPLMSVLDDIPNKLLPTIHAWFNVQHLFSFIEPFARNDDLAGLLEALRIDSILLDHRKRTATTERAGRRDPDPKLADARRALFIRYKEAGGTTKDLIKKQRGTDRSQISHWQAGRLPESSSVTRRIENEIRAFLAKNVGGGRSATNI